MKSCFVMLCYLLDLFFNLLLSFTGNNSTSVPVLNSQKSDSSVSDSSFQMEVDSEKASMSQLDVDSGFENMEVDESETKKETSRRQRV